MSETVWIALIAATVPTIPVAIKILYDIWKNPVKSVEGRLDRLERSLEKLSVEVHDLRENGKVRLANEVALNNRIQDVIGDVREVRNRLTDYITDSKRDR